MAMSSSATPRTLKLLARRQLEEIDVSQEKTKEEVAKERKKEIQKRAGGEWRLNLWFLLGIMLVVYMLTLVLRVSLGKDGFFWLFTIPVPPARVGEIASVLAPLLAVSVAVERLLETVFDWYEQSVRAVSDVVGSAREPIDWIEKELQAAFQAAKEAAESIGIEADEAHLKALDAAEQRLAKAEKRLLNWVNAPEYVAWKRALSIWIGLFVGLEVAIWADLGMFRAIGISAPRILDMLATGLVIGAGPGPMHSIIGLLQSGKDALENLADLAKGRAVREALAEVGSEAGKK